MSDDEKLQSFNSLGRLCPKAWFADPASSSGWLHIYTSLGRKRDAFSADVMPRRLEVTLDAPVACGFLAISSLEVPRTDMFVYAQLDGVTRFDVNAGRRALPDSHYCYVVTPMRVDGDPGNEAMARRRIGIVLALLRAHVGLNACREEVFAGEVEIEGDKYHVPSEARRVPQFPEGPFFVDVLWNATKEVLERLPHLDVRTRTRVELSLQFMGRAVSEASAFFDYWVAFEVLCAGKAQAVRHAIKHCYKSRNLQMAAERTGFDRLADWRHQYFHHGVVPSLTADVERHIQYLFLDLVRDKIGLPHISLLGKLQTTPGFDLTPLGLADNRTEEQKRAAEETRRRVVAAATQRVANGSK